MGKNVQMMKKMDGLRRRRRKRRRIRRKKTKKEDEKRKEKEEEKEKKEGEEERKESVYSTVQSSPSVNDRIPSLLNISRAQYVIKKRYRMTTSLKGSVL